MIFTLISTALGFLGAGLPDIIGIFKAKGDRRHELAILNLQVAQQAAGANQRLEEINAKADIAETKAAYRHDMQDKGYRWVYALGGTVRPVITYAFFSLFAAVKLTTLYSYMFILNISAAASFERVWDMETHALFAAIVAFWFGQRAMNKARGRG